MKLSIRFLAIVVGAIAAVGSVEADVGVVTPQAENPYASAEFTVSSDPTAVVLFIQVTFPMSANESQSMRLFGDGRLELTSVKAVSPEPRRSERRLDETSIRNLVGIAVQHGLAEWDATRIESEKAIALNGSQLSIADGYLVSVWLTLETYQRGEIERTGVTKRLAVATPSMIIRYFPNVIEFKGVNKLELYLRNLLKEEGLH